MSGYKINYPYYGKNSDGVFAILTPCEAVAVEHERCYSGIRLSKYISRPKIIKLHRNTSPISELEFKGLSSAMIANFMRIIPGAKITNNSSDLKLIGLVPKTEAQEAHHGNN